MKRLVNRVVPLVNRASNKVNSELFIGAIQGIQVIGVDIECEAVDHLEELTNSCDVGQERY